MKNLHCKIIFQEETLRGVAFGDDWWKHLLETFSKNRECRKRDKTLKLLKKILFSKRPPHKIRKIFFRLLTTILSPKHLPLQAIYKNL
jgi:hypothetical protein